MSSELTPATFRKHVRFMEHPKDSGEFQFLGPFGWTSCNGSQLEIVKSRLAERTPAADFVEPELAGGMRAFEIFVIPGVVYGR